MKGTFQFCKWILPLLLMLPMGIMAVPMKDYELTVKVKGLNPGDTCMIAYYHGTKQYIQDTILVGPGGVATYKGKKEVEPGLYLFVMPGMVYFEFLFVEPKFSMETVKGDLIQSMKVKGTPENEAFFNYLRYLENKGKQVKDIQTTIATEKDSTKIKAAQAQMTAIDKEVKAFREQEVKAHAGKFFAKLVYASMEPEIPTPPASIPAAETRMWQLVKFRKEFIEHLDWNDDRLLRTPVVQTKIKDYLEKYTVDHPDSIIVGAEAIMRLAEKNDEMYRYCVGTITNMYAGTKKMCFDKVYVHMAGTYYVSGRTPWVDSTQLAKIKDRYYRMLYNDCDRKAVNLRMQDQNGVLHDLYGMNTPYTLLVFWAHDCGHCKKEMPQLYEFYKEYRDKGLSVYSVSTKEELDKWKDFIKEKGMADDGGSKGWLNVADPENLTQFRVLYDIYSTPVLYLLDENKNIIGKRLDINTLKRILHHNLGLPEPEEPKGEEPKPDH